MMEHSESPFRDVQPVSEEDLDKATGILFPDIEVQLTDEDGNAFAIIGAVRNAIRKAGYPEEAAAFSRDAMNCESYDHLLQLCLKTVTVL